MTCPSCGCQPCQCSGSGGPAVLANTQLINPTITGALVEGGTLNNPTINDPAIVGGTVDCTARGCTAGTGVCNDGIATNAKVCNDIANAISSSNAAFCAAVGDCLATDPTILCPTVATCINSVPGIINNTNAFGFNARATTTAYGVTRFATGLELASGSCLLALDPCTLAAALASPSIGTQFWNSFVTAVNTVLGGATLCDAVDACGFARLLSPTFTGIPAAPTAALGTNTTQIATTAFVSSAISAAISQFNPAFCTAVSGCGGGGGGGGGGTASCAGTVMASGTIVVPGAGLPSASRLNGCSFTPDAGLGFVGTVTFSTPLADTNYDINFGSSVASGPLAGQDAVPQYLAKSTTGFTVNLTYYPLGAGGSGSFDFTVTRGICAAGGSAPGNFASFTISVTQGSIGTTLGGIVANYGCSVGPGYTITFNTPQPDTRWTTKGQAQMTTVNGVVPTPGASDDVSWSAALGNVNGFTTFVPAVGLFNFNDPPVTIELTFVCSR